MGSTLAGQLEARRTTRALNTVLPALPGSLGRCHCRASPVVPREGAYQNNTKAGVALDVTEFDAPAKTGDQLAKAGDLPGSIDRYQGALDLYGGDLAFGSDVKHNEVNQ